MGFSLQCICDNAEVTEAANRTVVFLPVAAQSTYIYSVCGCLFLGVVDLFSDDSRSLTTYIPILDRT
jgi:hypothetical protein